ncbi:hypothetical protein JCM19992_01080 [Thermostilla marina]
MVFLWSHPGVLEKGAAACQWVVRPSNGPEKGYLGTHIKRALVETMFYPADAATESGAARVNGDYTALFTHAREKNRSIPTIRRSSYFAIQPIVGWLAALVIASVIWPVIVVLAVLVKLTSKGPAFYVQERVGRDGRIFRLFKLRSMRHDAEQLTGPVWTDEDDPRITPFGRFLRKTHLDELPQLYNVLRGEMTIVGPRPERPNFVEDLKKTIPAYDARHLVLPGITGLAQINLPPDTDLESVRRKLVLDLDYVQHATLWLDLRIMLCTAAKMFRLPGLIVAKWLGIRRDARVPAWMQGPLPVRVDGPTTFRRAFSRAKALAEGERSGSTPQVAAPHTNGKNGKNGKSHPVLPHEAASETIPAPHKPR